MDNGLWDFGIQELFLLISSILTLLAVIVSLYLANKAKRLKYRIIISDNGTIRIINRGEIKFIINAVGYVYYDRYIFNYMQTYNKVLSKNVASNGYFSTNQETQISRIVIEPGDYIETTIKFIPNIQFDKKIPIFILINSKIVIHRIHINKHLLHYDQITVRTKKELKKYGIFRR